MAEVKIEVCKSCKKFFHTMKDEKICPDCRVEELDEFKRVKTYIRAHKGCGVEEVSQACDVTHKQILNWVREERLYFADESMVSIPCLSCGRMISSGKYCDKCLVELKDELEKESSSEHKEFKMKKSRTSGKISYISQDHS